MKNLIFVCLIVISGCSGTREAQNSGVTMNLKNEGTTTCQLIEKPFIIKNGVASDVMELYLRCSVQDYFIKVCEGSVSVEELRKHLNEGITVQMEFKEGEWDRCEGDFEAQSRVGTYVTINAIEQ